MPKEEDLATYLQRMYGRCRRLRDGKGCPCARMLPELQHMCREYERFAGTTWEDLKEFMRGN